MSVRFESAIGSHVGMVRSNNQDSGFSGSRLFLVADGMGGHAGGDVASALATRAMAKLDADPIIDAQTATNSLRSALLAANRMLRATVGERPELSGMGTTFTGFITSGEQLGLAHIGDSRLYLIRDGQMRQITKDHTFVQRLVDSGRITEEEAKTHPRRSVLMRVLGDVDSSPEIDTQVLDTQPGDVWLLCSDGLCGYVEDPDIERIILSRRSLEGALDALIDKSLSHGAPDNVTAVLVETFSAVDHAPAETTAPAAGDGTHETSELPEASGITRTSTIPTIQPGHFVGSAATEASEETPTSTARTRILQRRRTLRRAQPVAESHFEPRVDEYLAELIAETKRRNWRRRIMWLLAFLAILGAIAGALALGYQWTQTRYFVGTDGNTVLIFRGIEQNIIGFPLSSIAEDTEIPLSALTGLEQRQVERTLVADSLSSARDIVSRLGVNLQ